MYMRYMQINAHYVDIPYTHTHTRVYIYIDVRQMYKHAIHLEIQVCHDDGGYYCLLLLALLRTAAATLA